MPWPLPCLSARLMRMVFSAFRPYRLALTGASYAHVSDEAGATGRLLRSEYYRKASKEDAERYFSLIEARISD